MNPDVSRLASKLLQAKVRRQPTVAVTTDDEPFIPLNVPNHGFSFPHILISLSQ
jgi:hypothetical protein